MRKVGFAGIPPPRTKGQDIHLTFVGPAFTVEVDGTTRRGHGRLRAAPGVWIWRTRPRRAAG
ncbi:hypothetical protein AB0J20_24580 [Micromonospora costi]|uniref:hypothetical protein n=1 Tax=Micromonospora costi TaxID=1530042 RepID=UPI0033C18084